MKEPVREKGRKYVHPEVIRVRKRLCRQVAERALELGKTQIALSEILLTNQGRVNDLLQQRYEKFSIESLMTYAFLLGYFPDVEID